MRDEDLSGNLGNSLIYGRIASVDLAGGRVTVALGDVETAPIRWFTGGAGGTRVWSRPQVGEQVLALCPDGDIAGAIALRGVSSDRYPPIGDATREIVQFEDGAIVAYDPAAHAMEIALPHGAKLRIEADVEIGGALTVSEHIEADGDVKAGTVSLRDHRHDKVQAGGAISGKPLP